MKKYLKISVSILMISITVSMIGVNGYVSPGATSYASLILKANRVKTTTSYRTKTNYVNQQYYHTGSSTKLTPDCTDCQVTTELYNTYYGRISYVTTVKGQLINFNSKSQLTGDYYLKLYRADTTLLKTTHNGTWYININK